MGRVLVVLFLLALLISPPAARAAELTEVADSFDDGDPLDTKDDDPFDLNVEVGYHRYQKRAKMTGEQQVGGGDTKIADIPWLRYTEYSNQLHIRWSVGLYKDVEIHGALPYQFDHDKHWRHALQYRKSVEPFWSIEAQQAKVDINGDPQASAQPVIRAGESYRKGLGDPSFGAAWGILNDARDRTKPSWVISADYTPAIVRAYSPTSVTTQTTQGAIGDKVHELKFAMGLSKRLGVADPYMQLHYTLPLPAEASVYDPCNDGNFTNFRGTRVSKANCDDAVWKGRTALKPPHVGGFIMGTELVAFEDPKAFQKVSFDLRFSTSYISESRTYSELTDALQRLTFVEQYVNLEGSIGLYVRAARYVQFRALFSLGHDTQHLLTGESLGRDVTAKGQAGEGQIELSTAARPEAPEQNPLFDYRIDSPGRRVRITETSVFQITAFGSLNF